MYWLAAWIDWSAFWTRIAGTGRCLRCRLLLSFGVAPLGPAYLCGFYYGFYIFKSKY